MTFNIPSLQLTKACNILVDTEIKREQKNNEREKIFTKKKYNKQRRNIHNNFCQKKRNIIYIYIMKRVFGRQLLKLKEKNMVTMFSMF